jgi:ADP-ribose pyrophosphatase YjhB (NUDIX family)
MSASPPPSFSRRVPPGDDRLRRVCDLCGFTDYENPRIVVGSVVRVGDGVLLCRRAIEPSHGLWTLPAGYMELGETVEQAACREAMEEACADIRIQALLAVYSIPRIGQVQLMHLADLADGRYAAGPESLEVAAFAWDDIPYDELAFPSVRWALTHAREVWERAWSGGSFVPYTNPRGERGDPPPGSI